MTAAGGCSRRYARGRIFRRAAHLVGADFSGPGAHIAAIRCWWTSRRRAPAAAIVRRNGGKLIRPDPG
jgi:hypothetical protein